MNTANPISGGLFPFGGSFGDIVYHVVVALVWVVPLAIFLPRFGYSRWLSGLAIIHVGFAAILLWFMAFPNGWTPPEDDA